jgi:DNA-binding GntR family transcriptional regulator
MKVQDAGRLPTLVGSRHLSENVADAIVGAIAQGMFQSGERLVEETVARELEVSRVPIREAIRILQAQGILVVTPNRGARIAALDDATIVQVHEARIAIETIAVKDAMKRSRRNPELLDVLRGVIARMEAASRRSDWAGLRRLDLEFHRELCIASGNGIVLKLWEAISRHIAIIFGREIASERNFRVVIDQHRKFHRLLSEGSPKVYGELRSHILRLSRQRLRKSRGKAAPPPSSRRPRRA